MPIPAHHADPNRGVPCCWGQPAPPDRWQVPGRTLSLAGGVDLLSETRPPQESLPRGSGERTIDS